MLNGETGGVVTTDPNDWFRPALAVLADRADLTPDQAGEVVGRLLDGDCDEAQAAALLVAQLRPDTSPLALDPVQSSLILRQSTGPARDRCT